MNEKQTFQTPPNMEGDESNENAEVSQDGNNKLNFWQRNGATIVTLAILGLIIGGAIAVNERRAKNISAEDNVQTTQNTESNNNGEGELASGTQDEDKSQLDKIADIEVVDENTVKINSPQTDGGIKVSMNETGEEKDRSPPQEGNGPQVFKMTAQPGEGRTHMARRAITQQLKSEGIKLSPEQRVFAEDFLQKKFSHINNLHPGDIITFTADQVNEAISTSQNLTPAQTQNLSQFSSQVSFPPI